MKQPDLFTPAQLDGIPPTMYRTYYLELAQYVRVQERANTKMFAALNARIAELEAEK